MWKRDEKKITAPRIWRRIGTGFRIQDLREKNFDETLSIIKKHYVPNDVLCRLSHMERDCASVESFLEGILGHLKGETSLVLIDETVEKVPSDTDVVIQEYRQQIAGVLILRSIEKFMFGRVVSRSTLVNGEAQQKCVALKTALNKKEDLFDKMKCEVYLRFYYLCIKPEYRRQGLGFKMMAAAVDLARAFNIPVITGVLPDIKIQNLAKKIGMEILHEIRYEDWTEEKELVFKNPSADNPSCALMAGRVVEEPLPEPLPPKVVEDPKGKKGKKGKDGKKKKK